MSPRERRPRPPALTLVLVGISVLVGIFLILPVFVVIPVSFSASSFLEFPPRAFSLRWYREYFESRTWIDSTLNSVKVATFTALFATAVGTCAALAMQRSRLRFRAALTGVLLSPMILPHIVLAVSIYPVFARLKLIGSIWGLVAVYTLLATPFVYLNVSAALQALDPSLEQAALSLGATRWRALWHVTLPLIRPGIISGALLAMILAFDEVVIALFLTGTTAVTLPKTMWDGIRTEINPTIAAVSSFLVVTYVVLLAVAALLRSRTLAVARARGGAADE
jgi:putative spermidine/putrescine transport system permease protein